MLVPVVCFTCGLAIGDREDLFRHMRAERVRALLKSRGTTATQAAVDVGLEIDCTDILDLLGVTELCCRTHLVTAMGFADYW
jgi:DNA-directed RNA polymerase subunit N (RpoN/RPB10)